MRQVRLNWQGGEHDFALRIGELRALQDATGRGPVEILRRLGTQGTWHVDDVLDTLRLGLIGGGSDGDDAQKLVMRMADRVGLLALVETAHLVIGAALVGVEDDPVGEPEGATTPPADGSSAASTEPAQ